MFFWMFEQHFHLQYPTKLQYDAVLHKSVGVQGYFVLRVGLSSHSGSDCTAIGEWGDPKGRHLCLCERTGEAREPPYLQKLIFCRAGKPSPHFSEWSAAMYRHITPALPWFLAHRSALCCSWFSTPCCVFVAGFGQEIKVKRVMRSRSTCDRRPRQSSRYDARTCLRVSVSLHMCCLSHTNAGENAVGASDIGIP